MSDKMREEINGILADMTYIDDYGCTCFYKGKDIFDATELILSSVTPSEEKDMCPPSSPAAPQESSMASEASRYVASPEILKAVRRGLSHWTDLDESERTPEQLARDIAHFLPAPPHTEAEG